MKNAIRVLGILCLAVGVFGGAEAAPDRIQLRVLYAGVDGSPRTPVFVKFLEQQFTRVGFASYSGFKPDMANDYDVVIFDAAIDLAKGYTVGLPPRPVLPLTYDRPTILMSYAGVKIADNLNLKFHFLCMCLDGFAHDMAPKHPIFRGPLPVDIELKQTPTPHTYFWLGAPNEVPKALPTWQVVAADWKADRTKLGPGSVVHGQGFADSPDCEVISGGINEKGRDSLAIGRQGSFLYWGFEAGPEEMTPSGRDAFVNSVVYISGFDHAPVLVRKDGKSRVWTTELVNSALNSRYGLEDSMRSIEWQKNRIATMREKAKTQTLTPAEQSDLNTRLREPETLEAYTAKHMSQFFPAAIRAQTGGTAEGLRDYYRANYNYLVSTRLRTGNLLSSVDEDARSLGIANNDVRILDKSIDMLAKGENPEMALRILRRYTTMDFATAPEWKAWLDKNRQYLFFSDNGGYRFYSSEPLVKYEKSRGKKTVE